MLRRGLLFYHRPMLEDGEIRYEFFHQPGGYLVHPAMDRLAMIIDGNVIREHWVTDGKFDQRGIDPKNATVKRGCQLVDELPLRSGDWNQAELRLRGDTMVLSLNGTEVYRRNLERTNQRNFGFFCYLDEEQVRVRNVVWRGDWPQQVPLPEEQEFWGVPDKELPAMGENFKTIVKHEFNSDEFPNDRFTLIGYRSPESSAMASRDGLHLQCVGHQDWGRIAAALKAEVQGDFDITARFENFREDLGRHPRHQWGGAVGGVAK